MSLPNNRNTTYAAGSQVKSADLDAMQDCIIAVANEVVNIPPDAMQNRAPGVWSDNGSVPGGWTSNANGVATGELQMPIPARVGDRLTGVSVRMKQATGTAGGTGLSVFKITRDATTGAVTETQIGATAATAGNTNMQTLTVAMAQDVAAGERYVARVKGASGTYVRDVYDATVTRVKLA